MGLFKTAKYKRIEEELKTVREENVILKDQIQSLQYEMQNMRLQLQHEKCREQHQDDTIQEDKCREQHQDDTIQEDKCREQHQDDKIQEEVADTYVDQEKQEVIQQLINTFKYKIDRSIDKELEQKFNVTPVFGGYKITDYVGFEDKKIIIPKEYQEKPIVELEACLFENCKSLEEVVINAELKVLPQELFYGCSELRKVTLPKTLERIERSVFGYCRRLVDINLPKSLKVLGDKEDRWNGVFRCTAIREMQIPEGVTEIGPNTFSGCVHLKKVSLPDTVSILGEEAFEGCRKLEYIRLSDNLKEIQAEAFCNCDALKEIVIPESVEKIGGNVFSSTYTWQPDRRYKIRIHHKPNEDITIKCYPGSYAQKYFRGRFKCVSAP